MSWDLQGQLVSPTAVSLSTPRNIAGHPFDGTADIDIAAADVGAPAVFNVAAYGATGDGTTDDSDAIQDAIGAAVTAAGGIVWLPDGTYLIGTTLTITGASNVVLQGQGTLLNNVSNAPMVRVQNSSYCGAAATLQWIGQWRSGSSALELDGSLYGDFAVRGDEWQTGIRVVTSASATQNSAYNDLAMDIANGVTGMFFEGGNGRFASNNRISRITWAGAGSGSPVGINFSQDTDSNHLRWGTIDLNVAGSIAVLYNSADPTNDVQVYENDLEYLIVQAHTTGTTAIKANKTTGPGRTSFVRLRLGGEDIAGLDISVDADIQLYNTTDGSSYTGKWFSGDYADLTGKPAAAPYVNVQDHGAVGDGSTDDTAAIQAAIDAVQAAGGGVLVFPAKPYLVSDTLTFTPADLSSEFAVHAYGARLSYTGATDAVLIDTNITTGDIQNGEQTVHFYGLHIIGTSAAACGIRNYGCSRASFTDTTLDGFTSTTSGDAALILDARFDQWVEECHFDGLEIKDTGNGVLFVSENDGTNDLGSVAASCMNNVFTAVSIWITQDGGKGLYGIGNGTSGLVQIARCVFNSVIVHPFDAADVVAFDLSACYCEGTQFNAPGVDFRGGGVTNLTGFLYNGANVLTIIAPTIFPIDVDTTFNSGTGRYVVLGGNVPGAATIDFNGNVYAPTLTLGGDLFDANGKAWIHQVAIAGSINRLEVGNAGTGGAPWLTANGDDTNVGLNIFGKGSGQVLINGTVPATAAQGALADSALQSSVRGNASGVASLDAGTHHPLAEIPAGTTLTVAKDPTTGFWPASYDATTGAPIYTGGSASAGVRPTARADVVVWWKGPDPSPAIVSTGAAGMRNGIDMRAVTS